MSTYWFRQGREVLESRGKVLGPKLAPFALALKYAGKGVPFKQLSALDNLLRFTSFLESSKIPYFLTGGTLLGAVRQSAFAGRPGDIDLGLLEEHEQQLLSLMPQIANTGFERDENYRHFEDKIVLTKWRTPHIDVMVYRPISSYQNKSATIFRHINAVGQAFDCMIDFSVTREGKIFDFGFPIPLNSEDFLENQYGSDWRTPIAPRPSVEI